MAKTSTANAALPQNETTKQRKKQAKREAKIMLKVEQAKKDMQRAEKKVTKAQANLESSHAYLRSLEEKLVNVRTSQQALSPDVEQSLVPTPPVEAPSENNGATDFTPEPLLTTDAPPENHATTDSESENNLPLTKEDPIINQSGVSPSATDGQASPDDLQGRQGGQGEENE